MMTFFLRYLSSAESRETETLVSLCLHLLNLWVSFTALPGGEEPIARQDAWGETLSGIGLTHQVWVPQVPKCWCWLLLQAMTLAAGCRQLAGSRQRDTEIKDSGNNTGSQNNVYALWEKA